MKIYDLVHKLLSDHQELRDSDKKLQWKILELTGSVRNGVLTYEAFMNAENLETIRRTRQKVQEEHRELQSSPAVQKAKDAKEATQGRFVYQESAKVDWEKMRRDSIAQSHKEDDNSLFANL